MGADDGLLKRERCWVCFAKDPVDGHVLVCPWTSESQITADDHEGVSRAGFLRWLVVRSDLERFLGLAMSRLARGSGGFVVDLETGEGRRAFAGALCDAFEQETNVGAGRLRQEGRSE